MPTLTKRKRTIWKRSGLILATVILSSVIIYVNDKPGGILDWRMSRAMGMKDTMQIPLGKTPEDAVQQFRNNMTMDVIHRELVDNGMLLFLRKHYQEDSSNLQVEFARKTWFGWKWGWGGEFSYGNSMHAKSALDYMSIPREKGLSKPFPLVFGNVLNSSIKSISITIKGTGEVYNAKLVKVDIDQRIWFVLLPVSATIPFDIKGFNEKGKLVAEKTIQDPRDSGSVELEN